MSRAVRLLLISILFIAGCSSSVVHYYTLTPPYATVTSASGGGMMSIDISVANIPSQMNRSELMVRRGDEELVLLENDRWASALGDEVRNALRISLIGKLAKAGVGNDPRFSRIAIVLNIQRFDTVPKHFDAVDATWRLTWKGADSPTLVISCPFSSREPISEGTAAFVAGYQRQMALLADDISVALLASARAGQPICRNSRDTH